MILRFAQLKRRIEYHCSEGAISLSAQAENITSRVSEIFHYYAAGMASRKAGAVIAAGFGRDLKRPYILEKAAERLLFFNSIRLRQ